jgi:hypothetical protein
MIAMAFILPAFTGIISCCLLHQGVFVHIFFLTKREKKNQVYPSPLLSFSFLIVIFIPGVFL